jgi:hypothetical protein
MKKVYASVVAIVVAFSSFAQVTPTTLQKTRIVENHTIALEEQPVVHSAAATGDTINGLYYDFSNAANWVVGNEISATYDWAIGTGVPSGDFPIEGIESTTAANGYALYDSDLFCASDDHYVQLANPVDLTGYGSVDVKFQQHYRQYQGASYVEVSTDGGTSWTAYQVNAGLVPNTGTDNPDFAQVNISGAVAANPSTVWIRFRYIGACDYSWMVDDVAFVEGASDDIVLTDVWHGDILLDWEYQQIPLAQVQEVVLGATVVNAGGAAQTNVIYTWDIADAAGSVASGTFPATNASIDPTVSDTTWYATGFTPSALGTYTVSVSAAGDQTDQVPLDNSGGSMFMVTEAIFAHDDEDNIEFQISGGEDASMQANEYKVGMYYSILAEANLTSVQIAFGANTTTSTCIVEVFDAADLSTALTTTVYDFQPGNIPTAGDIVLIDILIEDGDGFVLDAGTTYLLAVGNGTVGEQLWVLASDGDADRGQLRYGPFGVGSAIDWYTGYTTSPMIRANFDATIGIEENQDVSGVSVYPNPASDVLNVAFVSKENQDVTVNVISANGGMVHTQAITGKAGVSNTVTLDTKALSAGIYMVQLVGAKSTLTQRVVVQ